MAARDYSLTLTGVAQRLSSVLANTEVGGPNDEGFRQLLFSADPANTAAIYVGSSSSVSSSAHGFSLDPTQASQQPVALGPFERGPIKLSEIWVIGTNNEKLHLFGVPY